MSLSADDVIGLLGLKPHPEGGFFRETFRAAELPSPLAERGARAASTAIYFLLRRGTFSALHRVRSDEVWHHYLGASAELHLLDAEGHSRLLLGSRLERGERPQAVVPAGVLQATRVLAESEDRDGLGSDFTLFGCTVAPGFDFSDFELPARSELLCTHEEHRALIERLTRGGER